MVWLFLRVKLQITNKIFLETNTTKDSIQLALISTFKTQNQKQKIEVAYENSMNCLGSVFD